MNNNQSDKRAPVLAWFKSSYSGTGGGECVEVALAPGSVHVRDSKSSPGPILRVAAESWGSFVYFASGREDVTL
ncbi:DUF397 domain-containing protein [Streptomyces paludis]|uniref:DUF397 domain-containing protein n=1 Tax=Streptomyces paludis TaxID=2282738 RepID=A0A345HX62_9ACTN|nr:DUF397 domain-containing protein [Streptomyces paludis]AXG81286.1 DUF397 domain-containing protein [Streptomyces paludis]